MPFSSIVYLSFLLIVLFDLQIPPSSKCQLHTNDRGSQNQRNPVDGHEEEQEEQEEQEEEERAGRHGRINIVQYIVLIIIHPFAAF
tara:strand:- start:1544 stop:1801 length:258 start_codon:yes stop_codon:yes gene_type:complete